MTHYIVGLHHPHIDDNVIVELYADKTDPPSSIVARVEELKRLAYWNYGERWNFATGTRKQAIERGGVPQWKPVVAEEQTESQEQNPPVKRPFINDSDPDNPVFSFVVGQYQTSFSIQFVPREHQQKLAYRVAAAIERAYITGKKEARAEMQAAIRNALML